MATGALAVVVAALALSFAHALWRPPAPEPGTGPEARAVRVQVLNGSGEAGLGSRVAAHLRAGGYHVVEVRNADRRDFHATLVVARRADPAAARAVARHLGGPPVIRQAWDSDLADVTVVLGGDRSRLRLDP